MICAIEGRLSPDRIINVEPGIPSQLNAQGRLRHLITLEGLGKELITTLLDTAERFLTRPGEPPARDDSLKGRTVANLFFEPSTRTRASFELAAKRLSADVINLDVNMSSRAKGESILDTIYTLEAMQADVFVLRDSEPGIPAFIVEHVQPHVSVLNAGEAHLSHPTQGLLDALTIRQHFADFAGLQVAIVGDIEHSRVARSAITVLRTLGAGAIHLISPREFMPASTEFPGAAQFDDLDAGIAGAHVVIALRIQRERIAEGASSLNSKEYFQRFGLTADRLKGAHPDAIVMHPGPMNRNVEISDEMADGPRSVIRQQVTNGVAVRMAVLALIAESIGARNLAAARR